MYKIRCEKSMKATTCFCENFLLDVAAAHNSKIIVAHFEVSANLSRNRKYKYLHNVPTCIVRLYSREISNTGIAKKIRFNPAY